MVIFTKLGGGGGGVNSGGSRGGGGLRGLKTPLGPTSYE